MIKLVTEIPGPKARAYLELSRQYEPRSMSEQPPVVWADARGVWVTDVDGNTFLDFSSGVLVANAGHSHPRIVKEIREQAGRVINCYDFVNQYRPALARKLVEITPPNLDRAFILTTGSETTEAAMKMARKHTGRKEIIAFQGAFHGRTYGAMSAGGKRSGAGTRGFGPFLPQVYLAPFAHCYRCVFDKTYPQCDTWCFDYLDWFVETETESDIAAVITETYQGGAGSIIPPPEWMAKLDRWCRARDIVLIIDEVQASFGRTGKLFGFQHYQVTPNLLCLGKGISSTLPVAAVVGEARIMDALGPGSMSSTHGGNPLGARAALANIDVIIEEKLPENAARLGEHLGPRFDEMMKKHPCLGDARGMGLVWGLEIVKDQATKQPDAELAQRVVLEACQRGLLMIAPIGSYGNVLRLAPPLVITEQELDTGVDILDATLSAATGDS
ncbi:MAG TPA: aspartate aminotransferase family protein [Armatimonadota bacterium]|nr:aspartate aminotransferase family protein [Armatimonadota bacterium]